MLDEIDIQIIHKLARDGRISLTELSQGMEISRVAVASRIEKLIEHRMLRVSGQLNLSKLNYQTFVVEVQADKDREMKFRKLLEVCPKILFSFRITGGNFNHLLVCADETNEKLSNFIENTLKPFITNYNIKILNTTSPEFVSIKSKEFCNACKLCREAK